MQKKAIRIVSGSSYNAHTEPIFKELRILPLSKLILYFNLQLMQKFKQGFLPCSFNSVWSLNSVRLNATSEISLRNQEQLDIPFVRLASSEKMPLVNLPRTWEKFSDESIKILRNCSEFNLKLKKNTYLMNCQRRFNVIAYYALFATLIFILIEMLMLILL